MDRYFYRVTSENYLFAFYVDMCIDACINTVFSIVFWISNIVLSWRYTNALHIQENNYLMLLCRAICTNGSIEKVCLRLAGLACPVHNYIVNSFHSKSFGTIHNHVFMVDFSIWPSLLSRKSRSQWAQSRSQWARHLAII